MVKNNNPHRTMSRHPIKELIWLRDDRTCFYCNKKVGRQSFTVDHIIPQTVITIDRAWNLITSCKKCNQQKAGGYGENPLRALTTAYERTTKKPLCRKIIEKTEKRKAYGHKEMYYDKKF
jgi:5-methylcytosine-specific restriction endonuclease McrA